MYPPHAALPPRGALESPGEHNSSPNISMVYAFMHWDSKLNFRLNWENVIVVYTVLIYTAVFSIIFLFFSKMYLPFDKEII